MKHVYEVIWTTPGARPAQSMLISGDIENVFTALLEVSKQNNHKGFTTIAVKDLGGLQDA